MIAGSEKGQVEQAEAEPAPGDHGTNHPSPERCTGLATLFSLTIGCHPIQIKPRREPTPQQLKREDGACMQVLVGHPVRRRDRALEQGNTETWRQVRVRGRGNPEQGWQAKAGPTPAEQLATRPVGIQAQTGCRASLIQQGARMRDQVGRGRPWNVGMCGSKGPEALVTLEAKILCSLRERRRERGGRSTCARKGQPPSQRPGDGFEREQELSQAPLSALMRRWSWALICARPARPMLRT